MRKRRAVRLAIVPVILLLGVLLGTYVFFWSDEESVSHEGAFTGEKEEEEDALPVLRIFDKNMNGESFDDAIARKIMEKTGVKIEMVDSNNAPEETLQMMLVNGDYPDIILMGQNEMVNQFIEAGVFMPLDEMIGDYGHNIKEMYGDVLEKSRYTDDGMIYWFANWYGKDTDASAGVLMRKDYLIELVGEERANSTEPFTVSEYTEILHKFKEKYETINGRPSIALDLDSDSGNYEPTLKGIFGMKTYEKDDLENLRYLPATDRYRDALLWLNGLYRDGLICKQWIIDKSQKWESDLLSGTVFSTWGCYWDTDDINVKLSRKYGENAQFYCYKVVADDLDETQTTFNGRNSLGWDAIGITKNCEDPVAAIRLLDYLASEEGQYLLLWGIEGNTWDLIDGKHVPHEVFLWDWFANPSLVERVRGVRKWKWMIKNGNGSDGTPYDLTTKYIVNESVKFANDRFLDSDYWDIAEYSGLEPTVKSNLGLKWEKITQLYTDNYGSIICAPSAKEALALYDRMVSNMEVAGLVQCENYISLNYKYRMKKWNS